MNQSGILFKNMNQYNYTLLWMWMSDSFTKSLFNFLLTFAEQVHEGLPVSLALYSDQDTI